MEDGTSNDVTIYSEDKDSTSEDENRPIMLLFRRLLSNDNKQNTVLTNAQIIDILEKEFDMNIAALHELEIDIYLNTVKKFLKDWPQWDEFDGVVNRLKSVNAHESIQNIIDHKYKNLKEYLRVMLEATKPIAENTVKEVMAELAERKDDKIVESNVYMEVHCTRPQLNKFFFRKPCDDVNKSVFNVSEVMQSRISVNMVPLDVILNWWSVRVTVNLKFFVYSRETMHQLKHTLINKANGYTVPKTILKDELQIKIKKKPFEIVKTQIIYNLLDSVLLYYANNSELYYLVGTVFTMIKRDLEDAPEDIVIPAMYRKYSNKYPYVRYLYSESPTATSSDTEYDLQLEEILLPMHQFTIDKVDKIQSSLPSTENWLKIECLTCKLKFCGPKLADITGHFNSSESHSVNEPRWMCTNCKCFFNMTNLAEKKWHHNC